MGTISVLYGPEDLREVKSAYKQIRALFENKEYKESYDYSKYQHPYSFFRGSVLHKILNPFAPKARFKKLKAWLLEKDKALVDTKFGKFLLIGNICIHTPFFIILTPNNKPFVNFCNNIYFILKFYLRKILYIYVSTR